MVAPLSRAEKLGKLEILRRKMAEIPARHVPEHQHGALTTASQLSTNESLCSQSEQSSHAFTESDSAASSRSGTNPDAAPPSSAYSPIPKSTARQHHSVIPVDDALAPLFPGGGLMRGVATTFRGAQGCLHSIIASVTRNGHHVAIVGRPRLGLILTAELGADLSKIAVIADPGSDPVAVTSVLVDGIDLVVLGLGAHRATLSRTRSVLARARTKGAAIVVCDGHWDPSAMHVHAQVQQYDGTNARGVGRLTGLRYDIRSQSRSDGRVRYGQMCIVSQAGKLTVLGKSTSGATDLNDQLAQAR